MQICFSFPFCRWSISDLINFIGIECKFSKKGLFRGHEVDGDDEVAVSQFLHVFAAAPFDDEVHVSQYLLVFAVIPLVQDHCVRVVRMNDETISENHNYDLSHLYYGMGGFWVKYSKWLISNWYSLSVCTFPIFNYQKDKVRQVILCQINHSLSSHFIRVTGYKKHISFFLQRGNFHFFVGFHCFLMSVHV